MQSAIGEVPWKPIPGRFVLRCFLGSAVWTPYKGVREMGLGREANWFTMKPRIQLIPWESSEAEKALQMCPKLASLHFVPLHRPAPREGVYVTSQLPFDESNSPREAQPWAISSQHCQPLGVLNVFVLKGGTAQHLLLKLMLTSQQTAS